MKKRIYSSLLLAALSITFLSGCSSVSALQPVPWPETYEHTLPEPTPAATPAATGPSRNRSQYLSKGEARNIALSHAGLSENDVTRLRVDFDYDDGVAQYEVEFHHGGYEYSYEIHAENGKISSWSKDREN